MANKVFINDQDIIECHVVGDQTVETINAMGEQIKTLLAQLKNSHKPLLVLDDISEIGQVPPDGRKTVVSLGKTLQYDKLAFLGKVGWLQLGANLIIRATGRSRKLKYFSDRGQALQWLSSKVAS